MRGAIEEVLSVGDADRHGHPARGVPCALKARFAAHQASGARPALDVREGAGWSALREELG